MYLWSDRLGCENLVSVLCTDFNLKVFPNRTRRILFHTLGIADRFCFDKNTADIFVFEDPLSYKFETFITPFSANKINLQLITTEKETSPIGAIENGIVYVSISWIVLSEFK